MSCRSIQKQLSAYVDGQLGEKEIDTVLDHTQKCRVCNQLLNNFRKRIDGFENFLRKIFIPYNSKFPSPHGSPPG